MASWLESFVGHVTNSLGHIAALVPGNTLLSEAENQCRSGFSNFESMQTTQGKPISARDDSLVFDGASRKNAATNQKTTMPKMQQSGSWKTPPGIGFRVFEPTNGKSCGILKRDNPTTEETLCNVLSLGESRTIGWDAAAMDGHRSAELALRLLLKAEANLKKLQQELHDEEQMLEQQIHVSLEIHRGHVLHKGPSRRISPEIEDLSSQKRNIQPLIDAVHDAEFELNRRRNQFKAMTADRNEQTTRTLRNEATIPASSGSADNGNAFLCTSFSSSCASRGSAPSTPRATNKSSASKSRRNSMPELASWRNSIPEEELFLSNFLNLPSEKKPSCSSPLSQAGSFSSRFQAGSFSLRSQAGSFSSRSSAQAEGSQRLHVQQLMRGGTHSRMSAKDLMGAAGVA
eukprot:3936973-Rhodomonas_salina.1